MSVSEYFVDPSFSTASPGDTATWNSAGANNRSVTVGTDGFATIAEVITLNDGGTIWLSASNHAVTAGYTISPAQPYVIRGYGASVVLAGRLYITSGEMRFRDVALSYSGSALASLVKVSGGAKVGFTHCSFTATADVGVISSGTGTGVALNGCSFTGLITTNVAQTEGGAAASFSRTPNPVGGSCGRIGNHFRHLATVEAPAEYRTTAKDQKIIWVPVDQCYASVEPLRSDEYIHARLAGADATHRIEFPGGLTISPAFRVIIRERTYLLNAPLTTDTQFNKSAFTALERVA